MKERFQKYLDKKFKKIANTPEVEDLKEEIMNDLLEKSEEVKKVTKDEDKNYEICINSLGDLMSVIKEYKKEMLRKENRKTARIPKAERRSLQEQVLFLYDSFVALYYL